MYEEAFRKIKEATGVSDVNEVVHKIFSQEDQQKHLGELTKENQSRVERMAAELASLKTHVEELKYSTPGGRAGARKTVDGYEEKVAGAATRLARAKDKYERLARILISVKSGIDHLVEKLASVMPGPLSDARRVKELSDDTVVDVMYKCEKALMDVMTRIRASAGGAELLSASRRAPAAAAPVAAEGLGSLGIAEGDVTSTRIFNTRIDVEAAAAGSAAAERAAMEDDDSGNEVRLCAARTRRRLRVVCSRVTSPGGCWKRRRHRESRRDQEDSAEHAASGEEEGRQARRCKRCPERARWRLYVWVLAAAACASARAHTHAHARAARRGGGGGDDSKADGR